MPHKGDYPSRIKPNIKKEFARKTIEKQQNRNKRSSPTVPKAK